MTPNLQALIAATKDSVLYVTKPDSAWQPHLKLLMPVDQARALYCQASCLFGGFLMHQVEKKKPSSVLAPYGRWQWGELPHGGFSSWREVIALAADPDCDDAQAVGLAMAQGPMPHGTHECLTGVSQACSVLSAIGQSIYRPSSYPSLALYGTKERALVNRVRDGIALSKKNNFVINDIAKLEAFLDVLVESRGLHAFCSIPS